jgi:hypothetical protein
MVMIGLTLKKRNFRPPLIKPNDGGLQHDCTRYFEASVEWLFCYANMGFQVTFMKVDYKPYH